MAECSAGVVWLSALCRQEIDSMHKTQALSNWKVAWKHAAQVKAIEHELQLQQMLVDDLEQKVI